jgi:hypothetical protein
MRGETEKIKKKNKRRDRRRYKRRRGGKQRASRGSCYFRGQGNIIISY